MPNLTRLTSFLLLLPSLLHSAATTTPTPRRHAARRTCHDFEGDCWRLRAAAAARSGVAFESPKACGTDPVLSQDCRRTCGLCRGKAASHGRPTPAALLSFAAASISHGRLAAAGRILRRARARVPGSGDALALTRVLALHNAGRGASASANVLDLYSVAYRPAGPRIVHREIFGTDGRSGGGDYWEMGMLKSLFAADAVEHVPCDAPQTPVALVFESGNWRTGNEAVHVARLERRIRCFLESNETSTRTQRSNVPVLVHISDELCRFPGLFKLYSRFRLVIRQYACWKEYAQLYAQHPNVVVAPLGYSTGMLRGMSSLRVAAHRLKTLNVMGADRGDDDATHSEEPRTQRQGRELAWSFAGQLYEHNDVDGLESRAGSVALFRAVKPHRVGHHSRVATARMYAASEFVLSPRGNSIDCFRHYEATIQGSLPVVVGADAAELGDAFGHFGTPAPFLFATSWDTARAQVKALLEEPGRVRLHARQKRLLRWWIGEWTALTSAVSRALRQHNSSTGHSPHHEEKNEGSARVHARLVALLAAYTHTSGRRQAAEVRAKDILSRHRRARWSGKAEQRLFTKLHERYNVGSVEEQVDRVDSRTRSGNDRGASQSRSQPAHESETPFAVRGEL